MGRIKKAGISILLIFALTISSVGVNTQKAEASLLGWVAKKVVKTVAKRAVRKGVATVAKKAVSTVKGAYKKKQMNFKVKSKARKIYISDKVRLKPLLCYGNTIKWSSSNKKVATVNSKGVVTGKKAGKAVIKAVPSISRKVSRIKITVKPYETVYENMSLKLGGDNEEDEDDYCVGIGSKIKKMKVDKPSVAKVSHDTDTVYVKAKKVGKCKITLTLDTTEKFVITVKVTKIKKAKKEDEDEEEASEPTPEPTAEPEPTKTPKPTAKPEPTVTPGLTAEPEPTENPVPTADPEPDEPSVPELPESVW